MKRFHEMTDSDFLCLEGDGLIQELVDLECAYSQIPLLGAKPVRPNKPAIKLTRVYAVAGFYLTNRPQADRILQILENSDLYITDGWSESRRLSKVTNESYHRPKVEMEEIPTAEDYAKVEKEMAQYAKLLKVFDDENNAYEKTKKRRDEIERTILDAIDNATRKMENRKKLSNLLQRYRELANGDENIAIKFLIEAHEVSYEDRAFLGIMPESEE